MTNDSYQNLANRLKNSLQNMISLNQAAFFFFIKGRIILDNTLLVQEITHDEKKSWTRRKWLGIKIDFEKKFDRLE